MGKLDEVISLPNVENGMALDKEQYGFGLYEMQGMRPTQEDAVIARWYSEDTFNTLSPQEISYRLWTTYKLLNQHCCQPGLAGSTASTTVYDGKGNLITATLGDSVAFAVVYVDGNVSSVTRLNQLIHHPDLDKERLKQVGATVKNGRLQRPGGSLAMSRSIGDFEYSNLGGCDDAHIDVTHLADFAPETHCKVQIITTCDGFTDGAETQTKEGHEKWLLKCLQKLQNTTNLSEPELAFYLSLSAYENQSRDNISVVVQTLSPFKPFMMGVYDGHGGDYSSIYMAKNMGQMFDQQCLLTPQEYAQQSLSVQKNAAIYCRDNKDSSLHEGLLIEKKSRLDELSKSSSIRGQLKLLNKNKNEILDSMSLHQDNATLLTQIVLALEDIRIFIEALSTKYIHLQLEKSEFASCLNYVLKSESDLAFDPSQYAWVSPHFKRHKENIEFLIAQNQCVDILDSLANNTLSNHSTSAALVPNDLFKARGGKHKQEGEHQSNSSYLPRSN